MQHPGLKKAETLLSAGRTLYQHKHFESCISRCYYGVFHIYEARQKADYEWTECSEKEAKRLLDKTERFYHSVLEVFNHAKEKRA